MSAAKQLQTTEENMQVSELNAFELTIQEHEKELDFIPDMGTTESRKKSSDVVKSARKTWNAIDTVRLEKKKEAEKLANAIHEQGKEALSRLEVKYSPHKTALDNYKAEQKAKEEALMQAFNDACEWLRNLVSDAQFVSTEEIKSYLSAIELKDQDNTGINLSDNQKFEYSKLRMSAIQKIEDALQKRIIQDAEEERQRVAALKLEEEQEKLRRQQEEFERQQQEARVKQAAIDAKDKAEREAKEARERAEREAEEAKKRAEEAKDRAIQAEKQAEENAKIAAENARHEEIARQEAQAASEKAEQEKREANKKHVGKVRKEAKEALMKVGISEDLAKKAVLAINSGDIPHVSISY